MGRQEDFLHCTEGTRTNYCVDPSFTLVDSLPFPYPTPSLNRYRTLPLVPTVLLLPINSKGKHSTDSIHIVTGLNYLSILGNDLSPSSLSCLFHSHCSFPSIVIYE